MRSNLIKYALSISLLCLLSGGLMAESSDSLSLKKNKKSGGFSWDKIVFGGNAGGGGGNQYTTIIIAPTIGYRVTEKFTPGIGFKYIYFRDRAYNISTNIYGGNIFARYFITDFLFAHTEYEMLNGQFDPFSYKRVNVNNVWIGGGLRQSFGRNSYVVVGALWNINESVYSFPQSPQIIGGIVFGL